MVIRLPGTAGAAQQNGPQRGPEPAWARFSRTGQPPEKTHISMQAVKPDIAAYRVLGREPASAASREQSGPGWDKSREGARNKHNSSVFVSNLEHYRGKPAAAVSRLPLIGEIAAGQYDVTVAFQEYDCLDNEGGVVVDKGMARGGAYALRVRGTSMTHVGIEPGDIVIVRPQEWAEDGDFVVANYTEGEAGGSEGLATLKRFYKRRDHVFLQSATASTNPIRLFPNCRDGAPDSDTVKVQGVVTVVLKGPGAETGERQR